MYLYNSLPVAFTLPVAIYFHAQKAIHTPSGGSSQDGFDGDDVIGEGHPTIKGKAFQYVEIGLRKGLS